MAENNVSLLMQKPPKEIKFHLRFHIMQMEQFRVHMSVTLRNLSVIITLNFIKSN